MKSALQLQRNLFFLLLFSSLLFSSCITAPQIVPFESILQDTMRDREDRSLRIHPGLRVISSKAELEPLEDIFTRLRRLQEIALNLNQTDFSTHLLIIVFQGDQGTGGFEIEVQRIQRSGERVEIYARFVSPEPKSLVTLGTTSPYHLVRVRRAALPLADEIIFVLFDEASGKEVAHERYTNR